jgi:lipoprotein NlpD
MKHQFSIIIFLFVFLLLQGCASTSTAPVANRGEVKESSATSTQRSAKPQVKAANKVSPKNKNGYHIVTKGDTLYSIAWRYSFDFKEVASWNQVKSPFTIYPGQLIRLKPTIKKKAVAIKKPAVTSKMIVPKVVAKQPLPKKTLKPIQKKATVAVKKVSAKPVLSKDPVKWSWPAAGTLVKSNSPTSKKGIDISGNKGQRVKAAASGEVVYSGGGLLGYGKLIIIKHNETYLSAYAYNSKLLVKEGDKVKVGQAISEMGQDHTGRTVLHFEIRQNGKPINPTKYLPKKRA